MKLIGLGCTRSFFSCIHSCVRVCLCSLGLVDRTGSFSSQSCHLSSIRCRLVTLASFSALLWNPAVNCVGSSGYRSGLVAPGEVYLITRCYLAWAYFISANCCSVSQLCQQLVVKCGGWRQLTAAVCFSAWQLLGHPNLHLKVEVCE